MNRISDIFYLEDIFYCCLNAAAFIGEVLAIEKIWILLEAGTINISRYSQKCKAKDTQGSINSIMPSTFITNGEDSKKSVGILAKVSSNASTLKVVSS